MLLCVASTVAGFVQHSAELLLVDDQVGIDKRQGSKDRQIYGV